MPLTAAVTVERSLNSRFALETGILYNRLHADRTLHTLGIPVKLNMTLASTPKLDLYATVAELPKSALPALRITALMRNPFNCQ